MNKVILKTALKTLLAVIIAFILALLILCFGFPRTMADVCQKFGSYSFAASFSSLSYKYYGETDDLYNCVNYSILAKDDNDTVKYGKELAFADQEKFESYCRDKDAKNLKENGEITNTKQWILGNLAAAQYRKGDKEGALKTAKASLEGAADFPAGNAVISLTIEVGKAFDKPMATALKELLESANVTPSAEQQTAYTSVTKVLNEVINHQGE